MLFASWFAFTGALEQESWAAVQVPSDSQHLVDEWTDRAAQARAASSATSVPASNEKASPSGEYVDNCITPHRHTAYAAAKVHIGQNLSM